MEELLEAIRRWGTTRIEFTKDVHCLCPAFQKSFVNSILASEKPGTLWTWNCIGIIVPLSETS